MEHKVKNDYIGIIVAVPEEARLFKSLLTNWTSGSLAGMRCGNAYWLSHPVTLVVSGQGEENARKACQAMFRQYHPRLVINSGFCGALQAGACAGDIITSSCVMREEDIVRAKERGDSSLSSVRSWKPTKDAWDIIRQSNNDYRNLQKAQGRMECNMRRCWEDSTVTANRVISNSKDKFALGQLSGAMAVDMEAAAIAEIMSVAGLPWLNIRVVSDAAADSMPLDFNKFTDEQGHTKYGDILREAISKPALIPGLVRCGFNAQKATSSLRTYMQYLLKYLAEYEVH